MVRWYVGHLQGNNRGFEAFRSEVKPTAQTHGDLYTGVIGPFKTKRAVKWAEKYGYINPHFHSVEDAERLAKFDLCE